MGRSIHFVDSVPLACRYFTFTSVADQKTSVHWTFSSLESPLNKAFVLILINECITVRQGSFVTVVRGLQFLLDDKQRSTVTGTRF